MRDDLQRWLDGEIEAGSLPPDLREDADRWRAMIEAVREGAPPGMPAGLEARVLRAVAAEAERTRPGGWRRLLTWWLRPSLEVPPLVALLGVAAVALLLVRPWSGAPAEEGPAGALATRGGAASTVYVEFLLEAPAARSVAIAGDFNDWTPTVLLQDADGDGVWSGRIRLDPGVHKYMFVVDDSRWVTDPNAERYLDDGFGNKNALVAVLAPMSES